MVGTLFTGTSGFAYQEWKGSFYPEGLKDADMLAHYASRLRSVEINYTFRRDPSPKTVTGWIERSPETFRFAVKAHQRITHWLRLRDAGGAVAAFLDRVRGLGHRLGPILFQCPPTLRFDRDLLEGFVASLPPGFAYVMEFRHPSWEEARSLLAERAVGWCVSEDAHREAGAMAWEPFGYLRLHRTAYGERDLERWASAIAGATGAGRDVYCYFKHEEGGDAPGYAARLAELVVQSKREAMTWKQGQ